MKVSLTVAQFPITWDVKRNVELISEVLAEARPDDIVALPEGALSGYGPDLSVLGDLDTLALANATDRVDVDFTPLREQDLTAAGLGQAA
ncbi:hypothetical protein [Streptomyces tubercidicus]|uniref:hypothetical protein n=1 Tax=Streptomyces tubercidicus TaxID=47759 RepID=UPI0037980690